MPKQKKRVDAQYINEAILRDKLRAYVIYHSDPLKEEAYFEVDPKGMAELAQNYALTKDEVQLIVFAMSHRVFKTSVREFFRRGFDGDPGFYERMLHSIETNWEE